MEIFQLQFLPKGFGSLCSTYIQSQQFGIRVLMRHFVPKQEQIVHKTSSNDNINIIKKHSRIMMKIDATEPDLVFF